MEEKMNEKIVNFFKSQENKRIKVFDPYKGMKISKWIKVRADIISAFLKYLFVAVLIVGIYQMFMAFMFYQPPVPLNIQMGASFMETCVGLFILFVGLGVLVHGFNLVEVNR